MAEEEDRESIPRLYFEARTLAIQVQAEDEIVYLDAVMDELIEGDITQDEGWYAINEAMGRLKAATDAAMIGSEY
jgi:hypothetical protein